MAQTAGIQYGSGACSATASTACSSAGYVWASNTCLYSGKSQSPIACLIGQPDSGQLTIDWSIDTLNTQTVAYLFGGALFLWVTGIGIGMIISVIRRTRI